MARFRVYDFRASGLGVYCLGWPGLGIRGLGFRVQFNVVKSDR